MELYHDQATGGAFRLCYGSISGLAPTQCKPLLVEEAVIRPVHNLQEDLETMQANPSTHTHPLPYNMADTYNTRQDCMLAIHFKHLQQHLSLETKIIAVWVAFIYTL